VLIARCAWHRRYYGSERLLGVSSWRGVRIDFTDGICPKCAARLRADFRGLPGGRRAGAPPAPDREAWVPGIAVVAVAVMIGVLLIARPTHELPSPALVAMGPTGAPAPERVIPEPPPPAASPALVPTPAPEPARRLTAPRVPVVYRDASQTGRRPLPRATVVYRTRGPRDSAQSP
jgi:hypothetical protein